MIRRKILTVARRRGRTKKCKRIIVCYAHKLDYLNMRRGRSGRKNLGVHGRIELGSELEVLLD